MVFRRQMMKSCKGFTLVEILIVVVILGILAAIVVPQFTEASGEAKEARLLQDLQSVRSQLELYKLQHAGELPGAGTASIVEALTGMTDIEGALLPAGTAPGVGVYGPYLQKIPGNPFIAAGTANDTIEAGAVDGVPGGGDNGWFLNTVTGAFYADDDDHCDL
jgi:general secretion pathway protein G